MSPSPLGLRERKKQQTRERIVREAMELFAQRGFEPTTIVEIAEAAEIAPRTFFAYFPSKEDVVFHEFEQVRDQFAARLRERPEDMSVFEALRAWVVDWLGHVGTADADDRTRRALVESSPALQARERANMAAFEELVAEGVAADLGVPADSLRPRLVSAAAIAAVDALRDFGSKEVRDVDAALALLDDALTFLQGGLDALRDRAV